MLEKHSLGFKSPILLSFQEMKEKKMWLGFLLSFIIYF